MELFSLSPQPMWVYDINTLAFLDVNKAAVRHYGYSYEEFLNMTIKDIRPQEDVHLLERALKTIFTERTEFNNNIIYRHLKKNGEIIQVQIQSNFLSFNETTAELVLIHDITSILKSEQDLQKSKEELLKSERRFKALVQEGSDLIAIIDLAGKYQFVSENYSSILGNYSEPLVGNNAFDYIHPDDHDCIQAQLASIFEVKQVKIGPFRFRDANDQWRWITTTATNLLDDPSILGIVVNSRDITAEIEQSIELKLSNERYKLVLKASDEAICDWDIEKDVVEWGSGFHDIFGYDLSVYNNNLLSDNIHEDDKERVKREVQEAISNPDREIYYSEYRYYKANRQVIHIQHRGIFLRDKDGKAIRSVDTLKDITPHIQRIEHIEKQNKQLKQIAWTQSHNVRGPLARILALSDLLNANDDFSKCSKQLLKYLIDSATELDDAIKDIIRKAE